MLEYRIIARRSAPARATANWKQAEIELDITPAEETMHSIRRSCF